MDLVTLVVTVGIAVVLTAVWVGIFKWTKHSLSYPEIEIRSLRLEREEIERESGQLSALVAEKIRTLAALKVKLRLLLKEAETEREVEKLKQEATRISGQGGTPSPPTPPPPSTPSNT